MAAHVYAWQTIISLAFFFFSNLFLGRDQTELIQPSQMFDNEPDLKMNAQHLRLLRNIVGKKQVTIKRNRFLNCID